jgi:DNA primase
MRVPPSFLDDIRARLPVSAVVARKVALKRAGRELKGLSPFKAEKTPSFFVNDQKGFYHCFASGEHGDIFTFVMKTEGLSFPEAVERLAAEAGVPMPRSTERDRHAEDERQRLIALLEASANFYEASLQGPGGAEGRRYLEKRGVDRATIAKFRLGLAPNSKSALRTHLASMGFNVEDMTRAGMLVTGDDIPVGYDRFRHRVMFPISDPKGRVTAFGGRALDPDAPAKYLNSPETPLFRKSAVLFNAAQARALAHERSQIICVEGYMDVVALTQAGFGQSVAPLGTALTEEQLKLLWRMAPAPILCFDGDEAGRRAAFRAVDTVLPHLQPGSTVAFAFLPDGLDPDDLIRQQGGQAFAAVIGRTRTLIDVLWEREELREPLATPEQRAAFEIRLRGLVARIAHPIVRAHYEREIRETLWARNRAPVRPEAVARQARGGAGAHRRDGTPVRRNNTQADWRVRERMRLGPAHRGPELQARAVSNNIASRTEPLPQREALLLRTLLNHPWLIEDDAEVVANLTLTSPALERLRDGLLLLAARHNSLDRRSLHTQLEQLSLGRSADLVERATTHRSDKFAEPDAPRPEVEIGWRHALALHHRQVGLRSALQAAERAWQDEGTEDALARICEILRLIASSEALEFCVEDCLESKGLATP